jgi:hypothetical protein
MIGSGRVDLTVRRTNSVAAGDTKMKENQDVRGGAFEVGGGEAHEGGGLRGCCRGCCWQR